MLDKYKENQKMFYDYFMISNDTNHISHAYLIETNNVSYGFNLAIDLAKFFLCNGVYDEKICNLIDSGNYSNLKIIGGESSIKKSEIIDLKTDFSMKSVDDKRQVYILRDAEELSKSSANSLLKFLEEPEGDVIAILVCTKASNVLSTIVSRCQVVSLINDSNVYESVFSNMYEVGSEMIFEDFVKEKVKEFFEIYLNIEENGTKVLAQQNFYEIKEQFKEFLHFGYYLYYDALNCLMEREVKIDNYGVHIKKIATKNSKDDIIKKMEIINKFIFNSHYNVNMNLFIDNFIISMGSV